MRNNEKGITLVEVLASIVILTIVLVTVVNFFPQMGKTNNKNIEKNQAVNLAKGELLFWKGSIKTVDSFEMLKNEAEKVKCIDSISDTCYFLNAELKGTNSEFFKQKFNSEVIIWHEPDLSGMTKAHLIHIQIKDKENQESISETYGYIFIE